MSQKPKTKQRTSSSKKPPTDRATKYALAVLAGKIIAGPHVRDACKRHLNDIEHGHKRGLVWNTKEVERVINFFEKVLTIEVEYTDEDGECISEAAPFIVEPSQAFILGSIFGWKRNGLRRFRRAYVEIGKGNGKSPLAAGIGHYMLTASRKLRAEVYSAATDRDQADILFRDAVEMYKRSPALSSRLEQSGVKPVQQLTLMATASFFKPISSEKKGKSGIRPYCALIDEIHEHPNDSVIEMLRAGTKGNREALIFEITNSGHDKTSVCWAEHEYSVKIASGEMENDSWFSYVCSLDKDDEPFDDEKCWLKVNPLLGISIQHDYIREQVKEAKGMPSKENIVRRLNFCQWTDTASAWISRAKWEPCEFEIPDEELEGRECYGGLDMSYTGDLSACAWVFPGPDDTYDAFVDFWRPKESVHEAIKVDHVPYDIWANDGHLILTPGKVIKLPFIGRRMADVAGKVNLCGIAYDRYRHKELDDDLSNLGIDLPLIEHPQGFRRVGILKDEYGNPVKDDKGKNAENPLWMPSSLQELENAVIEGRLRVRYNPLLRWNVASAVVRDDPAGTDNRIFDKRRSNARIDGLVALAMAVGLAKAKIERSGSSYEGLTQDQIQARMGF